LDTWFVSTVERLPGELKLVFIQTRKEFETEAAAKRYAREALNKGLRVEAGTLLGPQAHVSWREAVAWTASGEAGPRAREPAGESRRGPTPATAGGAPCPI